MSNFKFPYFSRDIGEFWRRWHISLSTWFRDYLYIPLGGSKGSKWLSLRNVLIIFIVSGFWHGANWTFIIWGFIHSLFYIPSIISGNNRRYTSTIVAQKNLIPTIKEMFQMVITFFSTMIAWVFFRSDSVVNSFMYLFQLISSISLPSSKRSGLIILIPFIVFEWFLRKDERLNQDIFLKKSYIEFAFFFLIVVAIVFSVHENSGINSPFIYFQF